jgi:3-oxoacyl-[acyl-carrier-protein] synthase-3
VQPGALLLMPGFGGGLSYCAHLVRWGDRTIPLGTSSVELPPIGRTALQLIEDLQAAKTTPSPSGTWRQQPGAR